MTSQSESYSVSNVCSWQYIYRGSLTISLLFFVFCLSAVVPSGGAFAHPPSLIRQSNQQLCDITEGERDENTVRSLEPGKTIKRELKDTQSHIYQITLSAHQFMRVTAKQDGIDVVVQVIGPDGKHIFELDSESGLGERECVPLVAEAAGDYRLIVQPAQRGAAVGGYKIRIEEVRAATENDRALQEACKLYEKARKLRDAGQYDEALPLFERVIETRQMILGPDAPDLAAVIHDLAVFYYYKGDYPKVEPLSQRALAIQEKTLGPEHSQTAASLNLLAILYFHRGDYKKAGPLSQRALTIKERSLRPEHPKLAHYLTNLAHFYYNKGDHGKAEILYKRALTIREKSLGPENRFVAQSLNNLADLYYNRGDDTEAELLHQRALTIRKKVLGLEHPNVAESLGNLADIYRDRKDHAQAEPLYQRALAILEKEFGPEHLSGATPLTGLALLYSDEGDYARAEMLHRRALAIREKALGSEHPDMASSLHNLAVVYKRRGQDAKAEQLNEQALAIRKKALGSEHPIVCESLKNLAMLYAAKGDINQAVTFQSHANAVSERNLALNLTIGSERQKLAYLALLSKETNFTLSLHSQAAPDNPHALNLAFTTLLRRKGRGLDAMTNTIAILRRHATPEVQTLFDRLAAARSQLATLTLRKSAAAGPGTYRAQIRPLEEQVEELEAELSSRSIEFRAQAQPVTLSAIQAVLPAGGALIEFAVYTPQEFRTEKSKPPRYLAYVLPAQGQPKWVDLGEATIIDRTIDAWRKALRDPKRADVKRLACAVDEKVMQPVRPLLGAARRLLIAPDGLLNLVPFAALVTKQNRYLIERYAISYLTSGRDLLRMQTSEPSKNAPLVMANPTFGSIATFATRADQNSRNSSAGNRTSKQGRAQNDSIDIFFQPLLGTEREALAIKAILPEASVLLREQATETMLRQSKAPSILHIATHGFFLGDQESSLAETRGLSGDDSPGISGLRLSMWAAKIENPLLRSGLALAGVNEHWSDDDDGVLTAMEAASLDLWGTKLVVLSACDTGVGEVKNGEGVYGLRRALVLAGSETQVMSLWPVVDKAAAILMAGYYGRLLKGKGRGEALRQIQLEMLKDRKLRHPYYWASFIQAGEYANLDGKR
jgi:CHAT domain-containing protein/tetratricopeptide (TPR) repeat protein